MLLPVTDHAIGNGVVVLIFLALNLKILRQDEFEETAFLVGEAFHHAQFGVVLLENEHVLEDVPVEDWLGVLCAGCYISLKNFNAALLPDLELIPLHVGRNC